MRPARLALATPLVAAGCASILGFPDVPDIGEAGAGSGSCCDAGPSCVGVPCEDGTNNDSQADAAPVDDSDGPFTDAPIDAQATEVGDDSETEATGDDTATEPTGEDA